MPKILLIDDDADILLALRYILENNSFQVEEAKNSQEGINQITASPPDLIILDVMMDTTTEGFQFALALRNPADDSPYKAYREIPILMLTAIHETTPLRFGTDEYYLPVDEFVDKPIDPDDLLTKIDVLLKKASATE